MGMSHYITLLDLDGSIHSTFRESHKLREFRVKLAGSVVYFCHGGSCPQKSACDFAWLHLFVHFLARSNFYI